MTAWQVFRLAGFVGVRLEAIGGELRVEGHGPTVKALLPELRAHKVEIIALLQARAKIERNPPDDAEIERMIERMSRARALGIDEDHVELLADRLLARDREGDDRRCCLECRHAKAGSAGVRCTARRIILSPADAVTLQRCPDFAAGG